jgi:hypothetical protein
MKTFIFRLTKEGRVEVWYSKNRESFSKHLGWLMTCCVWRRQQEMLLRQELGRVTQIYINSPIRSSTNRANSTAGTWACWDDGRTWWCPLGWLSIATELSNITLISSPWSRYRHLNTFSQPSSNRDETYLFDWWILLTMTPSSQKFILLAFDVKVHRVVR